MLEKNAVREKMMQLGLPVSYRGFDAMVDMLEYIHREGVTTKITEGYNSVGRSNGGTRNIVERNIRYEIKKYYEIMGEQCHPLLSAGVQKNGTLTNKEFLARLHKIIYEGEMQE